MQGKSAIRVNGMRNNDGGKVMSRWRRLIGVGMLTVGMLCVFGSNPGVAQSRAHVYLLRGLMNIFSLGMDTLGEELERRGIYATVDNYAGWQTLADQAASKYRSGTEGPIILIGHSLGADAVMEMAAYLGHRGIPVALVVPFDCTGSYSASPNVARVLNLTKHYYMSRGPGFHGSLINVDLSSSGNIDHLNIDKSARLHARVIAEVLAIAGGHRTTTPSADKPTTASVPASGEGDTTGPAGDVAAKPAETATTPHGSETAKPLDGQPAAAPDKAGEKTGDKSGDRAINAAAASNPRGENGTPVIARPELGRSGVGTSSQ